MGELNLDELRGLLTKAGGEWSSKNEALLVGADAQRWNMAVVLGEPTSNELMALVFGYSPEGVANRAALIVAAVNALPALLAEIERLREAATKAHAWIVKAYPETEESTDWLNEDGWDELADVAVALGTALHPEPAPVSALERGTKGG